MSGNDLVGPVEELRRGQEDVEGYMHTIPERVTPSKDAPNRIRDANAD